LCCKSKNSARNLFYCIVTRFPTREYNIVLSSIASRLVVWTAQSPVQRELLTLSLKIKRPSLHVCLVSKLRMHRVVLSLFPYVFTAGRFVKYTDFVSHFTSLCEFRISQLDWISIPGRSNIFFPSLYPLDSLLGPPGFQPHGYRSLCYQG
jgi:hypothetical protein